MLYVIHGDRKISFDKSIKMIDVLLKKQPDASYIKLDPDNYSDEKVKELIDGQSLFAPKAIILISGIFTEIKSEFINKNLKSISESENVFVFSDGKLDSKTLTKLEKWATKIQESKIVFKKTAEKNNIFEITNYLGRRDKKGLWIKYQEFVEKYSAKEIINILWWQLKNIYIAKNTKTAKEGGLASYSFSIAQTFANNYSDQELDILVEKFLEIQLESSNSEEYIKEKLEVLIFEL